MTAFIVLVSKMKKHTRNVSFSHERFALKTGISGLYNYMEDIFEGIVLL